MRYFKTTNASRLYKTGGWTLEFQPYGQIGGLWYGTLAVEDDSAASALANAGFPQVTELTKEEYDEFEAQKKTHSRKLGLFFKEPQPIPLRVVESVADKAASPLAEPESASAPSTANPLGVSTTPVATIQTTSEEPPAEPLLIPPPVYSKKSRGASK